MFWFGKRKIPIVKDGCVHCAKIQTDQTAADKHETNHENQLYTDLSTVNGKTNHFMRCTRPIAC